MTASAPEPITGGVNHMVEMVRRHNLNHGSTFVCIRDFSVAISPEALLLTADVV